MSSTHSSAQIFRDEVNMSQATSVSYKPASINNADIAAGAAIERTKLEQNDLEPFPILLSTLRVWDAPFTNVVATTGANDDLALVYNTFLTAAATVETGDLKAAGATSRKVGFQIAVPANYVAGQTATLRLNAGMKTTIADVTATIDAQVTRVAAPSVDICATSATTINNLVAADIDFTLTPTNLIPGDVLDVVITIAVNDGATATAVIGKWNVGASALLLDCQG